MTVTPQANEMDIGNKGSSFEKKKKREYGRGKVDREERKKEKKNPSDLTL